MQITHNHNAKSQLAKLLATENITVQHKPDARTAWFDVKNRILCLPIWREMSNDLYDMLVVHEVGHALDTPSDGWLQAIQDIAKRVHGNSASNRAMGAVKGFLNVIEDVRIDKRQKRRFPGARRNYVKGYQELIEKNFFGTATRDVNAMSFIDRANIYFKGGAMMDIKFSREEKDMLARIEAAETFEEVLALTEEVYGWSKQKMQEQELPSDDFGSDESDEDSEGDDDSEYDWYDSDESDEDSDDGEGEAGNESDDEDSDDESGSSDGDGDEDSDDDSDESSDSDSDQDDNDGDIQDGVTKSSDGADGDDASEETDDIPESETEKAWQKSQEDLVVNSNHEYVYVKIPRPVNYAKVVVDYKQVLAEQRKHLSARTDDSWKKAVREELMKFRASENATISFMVKEFEMRKSADEHSRTSVSKTGVIDTNKLHSYKYNDDLFRRFTTVATGKNHGFVMFVDWSGSMEHNLKKTLKQMFSLAMFCKRVQIPFEVYSFRSINSHDLNEGTVGPTEKFFTQNQNELDFSNLFVRNILSSRMNVAEFNEAMLNLYIIGCGGSIRSDLMGSTPLNECIGIADLVINRFKAKSKVQVVNTIFLTDGEGDGIYNIHKLPLSGKTRKFILQDEITKKSYDIKSSSGSYNDMHPYADRNMTTLLLKVLKDRTGCNLLGFYINSDGFDSVYRRYYGYGTGEQYTNFRNQFKNEGWFPVSTAGYDEYYILNPKMFDVSKGKFDVTSDKMTKNKMAKEFIKFAEKKLVSRVLLSRFVKRIAA